MNLIAWVTNKARLASKTKKKKCSQGEDVWIQREEFDLGRTRLRSRLKKGRSKASNNLALMVKHD